MFVDKLLLFATGSQFWWTVHFWQPANNYA